MVWLLLMEITLHYGLPVLMEAERGSEGNNLLGDGYFPLPVGK